MSIKKTILSITLLSIAVLVFSFFPQPTKAQNVEEFQARITEIIQQIKQIQGQLAQLQAKPVGWCHDFNVNLRYGDSGPEVKALQTALEKEGFTIFDSEKQGSYFGDSTASAVVGFQEKYKNEILAPLGLGRGTGHVGPTTRAKLNKLYGCGVEDPVSGTLSVNKTKVKVGENIILTITAKDENGVDSVKAYYQGDWHRQSCKEKIPPEKGGEEGGEGSYYPNTCTKTFIFSETKPGTYTYSGYVYGRKLDGSLEEASTNPSSISVSVEKAIITPPTPTLSLSADPETITSGGSTTLTWLSENTTSCSAAASPVNYQWLGMKPVAGSQTINDLKVPTTFALACTGLGGSITKSVTVTVTPVVPQSLTVIQPNGGESWKGGKNYEIKWSSAGSPAIPYVSIYLYKGGKFVWPISFFTPNDGSESWTIPTFLSAGNDYKIRISKYGDANIFDESDDSFEIIPLLMLSVSKAGTGSGTVISSPSGINCGTTCFAFYPYGTSVTLTATPARGSTFAGWSGACSGTGSCVVSMTAARSVTAFFEVTGGVPPETPEESKEKEVLKDVENLLASIAETIPQLIERIKDLLPR